MAESVKTREKDPREDHLTADGAPIGDGVALVGESRDDVPCVERIGQEWGHLASEATQGKQEVMVEQQMTLGSVEQERRVQLDAFHPIATAIAVTFDEETDRPMADEVDVRLDLRQLLLALGIFLERGLGKNVIRQVHATSASERIWRSGKLGMETDRGRDRQVVERNGLEEGPGRHELHVLIRVV